MKNLCLLTRFLLILLLSLPIGAQSQYIQEVFEAFGTPGNSNWEKATKIIQVQDGSFVLAGNTNDQTFLMKVSLCGDSLWLKTFEYGNHTVFNDLVETDAGNIIVVGACEACQEGDGFSKTLLVKTDENGLLLRDTIWGITDKNSASNALEIADNGDLIIAGFTVRGGLAGNSGHIYRLDSDFDYLWHRYYDKLYFDYFLDVTQTTDGGFGLTGHAFNWEHPDHLILFKTDPEGIEEWSSTFLIDTTTVGKQNRGNALKQLPNGNLIVCGTAYIDSLEMNDLILLEYDINSGDLIQSMTLGSTNGYIDIGYDVQVLQNGHLLISGKEGGGLGFDRALILTLDDQLNETARHYYYSNAFANHAFSVIPLSETGEEFAFCGQRNYFGNGVDILFGKRAQPGFKSTFTKLPKEAQLYPRNLLSNEGTVMLEGAINDPAQTYSEMRLKFYREGELQTPFSIVPLSWQNDTASFEISGAITAELANYEVRVYGFDGQKEILEACVKDIVAGDAYIIQGQSNAVASSTVSGGDLANAINQRPFIRVYGSGGENGYEPAWFLGDGDADPSSPGNTGQWGLRFASQIVDDFGIPVAIFNGAKSGAPSSYFLPQSTLPLDSSNYGRLLKRVQEAELENHIRSIFWFQGESDVLVHNNTNFYKQRLDTLMDAWYQDYPSIEGIYLFQIRNACFDQPSFTALNIMEAQRQTAEERPDVQIMSSMATAHNGCHFPYQGGYETLGDRIFNLVARDQYGLSNLANVEPPQIVVATLSDSIQITLEMKNGQDDLIWEPGAEADFILNGTAVTVTAGSVIDNFVVLELSDYPDSITSISYAGHIYTASPFVINGNGVSMLCFKNYPVKPLITSTHEESNQITAKIDVYPNPVKEPYFTIDIKTTQVQQFDLSFYNALGQPVKKDQIHIWNGQSQFQIASPTEEGIYFLKVSAAENLLDCIRLIVQR